MSRTHHPPAELSGPLILLARFPCFSSLAPSLMLRAGLVSRSSGSSTPHGTRNNACRPYCHFRVLVPWICCFAPVGKPLPRPCHHTEGWSLAYSQHYSTPKSHFVYIAHVAFSIDHHCGFSKGRQRSAKRARSLSSCLCCLFYCRSHQPHRSRRKSGQRVQPVRNPLGADGWHPGPFVRELVCSACDGASADAWGSAGLDSRTMRADPPVLLTGWCFAQGTSLAAQHGAFLYL
jgi:hypothetical protein